MVQKDAGSTSDWKSLSVDQVVNGTFFKSGTDKAAKDRDWLRLSYVQRIQWASYPHFPYVVGYGKPLPLVFFSFTWFYLHYFPRNTTTLFFELEWIQT